MVPDQFTPLPAGPPLAVQEVAFVVDHVSVALCPVVIVVGFVENARVGARGAGVTGDGVVIETLENTAVVGMLWTPETATRPT